MSDRQSLSHSAWECKYHVVRIPKFRKKIICAESRQYLGEVFRYLARQKECAILEGHLNKRQGCRWHIFHKPSLNAIE